MASKFAHAGALTLALGLSAPAMPQAPPAGGDLPTFAQLEATGATIGEIRVRNQQIFDTRDPEEDNFLFRTANLLHIPSREAVIRQSLLFRTGDRVRVTVIDETERILRGMRALSDVSLRPVAVRGDVVDIEVVTRDAWSLDPGLSYSRSGGTNAWRVNVKEYNFLGTGTALVIGRTNNVDRSGNEFGISHESAFGTWTQVSYARARNTDGTNEGAAVVRPFHALDARWAAGASWLRNDRIEAIYDAGEVASEYRFTEEKAELFGGWSKGLVNGWVSRYSLGARLQDDAYLLEPGRVPPPTLAPDQKLVYPFARLEVVEDRFARFENRNQLARPEFFELGLSSAIDVGFASTGMGSSRDSWVYSGFVKGGVELESSRTLMASAAISGQFTGGRIDRQQLGGSVQYYRPQGPRWLFYASASGDVLTNPGPSDMLVLGGDNGLRGYPIRYQNGNRRALFTLEERAHSDIFLWRLFRLGGAAYVDVGRAWGGPYENKDNPGWLANVGIGLRIFNVRTAFSNVLHVDIAVPLNPGTGIDRVQYLVRTRASF